MLQSPLNYTGGKYKLLPQLLPLFPQGIRLFVDLFCGGCNVGLNVPSESVLFNDREANLIGLYCAFQRMDCQAVLAGVHRVIERYGLSLVSRDGYAHYGCDSSRGLAGFNRQGFLRLRDDFNRRLAQGPLCDEDYLLLYVLIVYGFNNQIRFNAQGAFNLPVGKRDFNARMEQKLRAFIQEIQARRCTFTCLDFRAPALSANLGPGDFVYADPPYLITCATYNEQGGWGEEDERALLAFLDGLDGRGVRFALSNVLRSKGRENGILLQWLAHNAGRYRAAALDYSYANSSYHTKDKTSASEEVLIVNYPL